MRLDVRLTVMLIADTLVCICLQLIVLSIVAATLLIRPVMYTNSVPDGQLFVSLPFAMMVGLMMDNFSEMSITLESMHVMFRQRANCFYPGWAYAIPTTLLRIPYSFLMAFLLSCIIYWVVGYDPNPGRYIFSSPLSASSCETFSGVQTCTAKLGTWTRLLHFYGQRASCCSS